MPFPAGFSALNHRDFRVFWTGQIVSQLGTWMQRIGQAWLVLELTNSALKLGIITALQFTPVLLFAMVGGAVADRVAKRKLLVLTQTVLMLQAAVLTVLVWTGTVRYWHVAILASVYGLANAFDMPARQSFVAEIVGRKDLMNAIALNSAMFNSARLIGPAVAGVAIARFGLAQTFFFNAVSFVAVLIALAMLRTDGRPQSSPGATMLERILGGLQYAGRTPVIRFVLSLLLSVSFFVINFNVLVPLIAKHILNAGAQDFGWLMASLGAGAIMGALTLALLVTGRPPISLPITAAFVASAGTIGLATVGGFPIASGILVVIGFAQITFQATCNTILQITAPDALRGRVMSLYAVVFAGITPFGSLVIGSIAEKFGTRTACTFGGAGGLLAVALLTALMRPRRIGAAAMDSA